MPSPYRILVVAAHAAAIAFLLAPRDAQASPMPMPLSSYSSRNVYDATPRSEPSLSLVSRGALGLEDLAVAGPSDSPTVVPVVRDVNTSNILSNINLLNTYYNRASTNSGNLSAFFPAHPSFLFRVLTSRAISPETYASQASSNGNDPAFQQQCKDELTAYQASNQGFQTALAQISSGAESDKGLGNYDKNNDLETLLKNFVNLNKDTLSDVTELTYSIPVLGPTLGPSEFLQLYLALPLPLLTFTLVVYEIKCILDAVLDATEDLTDDLLNRLGPILQPLISDYQTASCNMASLKLGDICIL